MKTNKKLTDAELEQIAASKDSTLAVPALLELRRRSGRRAFWGVTVPAWVAVVIAVLALLDSSGILKFRKNKDSVAKAPSDSSASVSNTIVAK